MEQQQNAKYTIDWGIKKRACGKGMTGATFNKTTLALGSGLMERVGMGKKMKTARVGADVEKRKIFLELSDEEPSLERWTLNFNAKSDLKHPARYIERRALKAIDSLESVEIKGYVDGSQVEFVEPNLIVINY